MKRLEEGFLSRLFTNVDVGVDLGTSNLLIFLPERGIVYREPSMVAIDKTNGKVVAVGRRAKEMLGKTPDRIDVVQPLAGGVVADYEATAACLVLFSNGSWDATSFLSPVLWSASRRE